MTYAVDYAYGFLRVEINHKTATRLSPQFNDGPNHTMLKFAVSNRRNSGQILKIILFIS